MQLKTYSNENELVADFLAYSRVDGDSAAGRRVQNEIDGGTSLREIAQLATRYARGDNVPLAVAKENGRKQRSKKSSMLAIPSMPMLGQS